MAPPGLQRLPLLLILALPGALGSPLYTSLSSSDLEDLPADLKTLLERVEGRHPAEGGQILQTLLERVEDRRPTEGGQILQTLLERVEDRRPAEGSQISLQGALGQSHETREASKSAPFMDGYNTRSQREATLSGGSWELPDRVTPVKSQLRELLNPPRIVRRSDCFGVKLDKIGTLSGLGCNN